jgi:hypothetical protein
LVLGVIEGISATLKKRLMGVHAAAIDAEDGLRHEGNMDTLEHGNGLHHGRKVIVLSAMRNPSSTRKTSSTDWQV